MKKLAWFVVLFIGMISLVACQSKESSPSPAPSTGNELSPLEEPAKVVIAEDGSASGAGFYIAKDKGYFEKYNIEVEFATFGNSDEMLPAVASGEVDVAGGISSASFFNSIAQGIDVRFIADKGHNNEGSSYFTFVVREDLKDVIIDYSDIKGKKIAVSTKNGVDDYIYHEMLKHAGVSTDEVEFVLMSDFGNMMSAMGNQQIDLALQIEPLITQGENQGIHQRFGDATDYAPEAQIAMVLGSPNFLTERRDVAVRFMAAYLEAVRDYHDVFIKGIGDEAEIISIMANHTALKDEALWEQVGVTGLNPNGYIFEEDVKKQYEFYKENGAIQAELDFEQIIDMSLVEEAIEIIGTYEE
ncbi:taurine ABC transporter substrate-binding protein [Gracilibacillus oryzae]|uniref:Taurine ABC transporter substrate-binding protein n=1 Tax=Gracilibacillus oryzae TaxID=1672701 RepID=A0A7C8KPC2_9BACI|nr:ABC transporter substrate-binding protein [Gracilibacillus oryzae]KAB8131056.1 taurine ABC transporter substrate-binding protein [Gracilibacillus oryzae]